MLHFKSIFNNILHNSVSDCYLHTSLKIIQFFKYSFVVFSDIRT